MDLRSLQLTGGIANIAMFLEYIMTRMSELTSLELVIWDPPDIAFVYFLYLYCIYLGLIDERILSL